MYIEYICCTKINQNIGEMCSVLRFKKTIGVTGVSKDRSSIFIKLHAGDLEDNLDCVNFKVRIWNGNGPVRWTFGLLRGIVRTFWPHYLVTAHKWLYSKVGMSSGLSMFWLPEFDIKQLLLLPYCNCYWTKQCHLFYLFKTIKSCLQSQLLFPSWVYSQLTFLDMTCVLIFRGMCVLCLWYVCENTDSYC